MCCTQPSLRDAARGTRTVIRDGEPTARVAASLPRPTAAAPMLVPGPFLWPGKGSEHNPLLKPSCPTALSFTEATR